VLFRADIGAASLGSVKRSLEGIDHAIFAVGAAEGSDQIRIFVRVPAAHPEAARTVDALLRAVTEPSRLVIDGMNQAKYHH